MKRLSCPARFRVRASTLAALSLGGLAFLGTPPAADAAGMAKTRSVLREIYARLKPGGLDRPRPEVKQTASARQRHGSAHARRRELAASRRRGAAGPADRDQNPAPGAGATPEISAHVAVVQMLSPTAAEPGREPVHAVPAPVPVLALRSLVPGGSVPPPAMTVRTNPEGGGPPVANPTPVPEASRRPDPVKGKKEPSATSPAPAGSPTAPVPPGGKPLAETSAEVREKFETAQGLYTRHDAKGALQVLAEIETLQPNVTEVRNLRALVHYELAYRQYIQQDYTGALHELDEADDAQAVADTANLRGLVLARQRQYVPAEAAFRKAVAADPTLWAAKFNLADLPFSYRNFTEARQRFEALTAETDRATQPRQAELTEFKVFLTLLLEGRESAARSFLNRFKTDGSTPARIYGQAALDFHAGRSDRAIEAIKEARKKYPPQLEAIFAESFYRVGWLTDGTATAGGSPAVAAASPVPTPIPAAAALADATPTPPEAMPTPAVAVATPAPTPEPTPAAVIAAATPPPPAPVVATPPPAASTPAVVAAATPKPTPAATPVSAEPTRAVAVAAPPPAEPLAPTPAAAAPPAVRASPPKTVATRSPAEVFIRHTLPWFVLLYLLAPWVYAVRLILTRRRSRLRARRVVPLGRYPAADKVLGREKV